MIKKSHHAHHSFIKKYSREARNWTEVLANTIRENTIVHFVSVFVQRTLSVTMLTGLLNGSCQSHDAWHLYNITGVTAHGQDDQDDERKQVRALDKSWTWVGMKKAQVKLYLDKHLQPFVVRSVWKGLEVPDHLRDIVEEDKGVVHESTAFHITPVNPSKGSGEYLRVLWNNVVSNSKFPSAVLSSNATWECATSSCNCTIYRHPLTSP